MTTANDAAPNRPPADAAPSANGASTLRDRVRSLRLAERAPEGKRSSLPAVLLPWGLCVILLGVCVAFGYYAYAIAPSRAAVDAKAEEDAATTAKSASSPAAARWPRPATWCWRRRATSSPSTRSRSAPRWPACWWTSIPGWRRAPTSNKATCWRRSRTWITERPTNTPTAPTSPPRSAGSRPRALFEFQVQQAQADLADARSTLTFKEDDLRRDQRQFQGRSISESDMVKAQTDAVSQRNIVERLVKVVDEKQTTLLHAREAAEADMKAASADLEKAKWNLDNCTITAPVSGTILKKSAEKGNIVNPIAFNISASLCDMADLSDLEVDLKIQERDIAKVKKGQSCIAMPEAYQADPDFLKIHPKGYTGKVSRLMPTADRGQGAIPVRVKLDIPTGEEGVYLKPDMGIIVEFLKGTGK